MIELDEKAVEAAIGIHRRLSSNTFTPALRAAIRAYLAAAPAPTVSGEPTWADESRAMHWIDRYAAGLDDEPQMDRILECVAAPTRAEVLGRSSTAALNMCAKPDSSPALIATQPVSNSYKFDPAPAPTVSEPVAWIRDKDLQEPPRSSLGEPLQFWASQYQTIKFDTPLYTHPAPTRAEVLEEAATIVEDYIRYINSADHFVMTGPTGIGREIARRLRALAGEKP